MDLPPALPQRILPTLVRPGDEAVERDRHVAGGVRHRRPPRDCASFVPTQRYRCVMIPKFDERGNLPPGIHHATWSEIVTRYATSTRRRDLLDGLLDALRSLKAAGCATAYLDGSFVTAKAHPDDF